MRVVDASKSLCFAERFFCQTAFIHNSFLSENNEECSVKLTELLIHFYDSIFYYKHHTKELLRENHKWKLHYLLFPGGHRMHISTTTAFALLLIDYQGGPGGRCEWLKSQWKLPELRRSVKITMSVLTGGYLHNNGSSVK